MPIIFIHGVATRNATTFERVEPYLREYIAPEIAGDPHNVMIIPTYWGDLGAKFAWKRVCRPRTPLLRHGPGPSTLDLHMRAMGAVSSRALDRISEEKTASLQPGSGFTSGRSAASPGSAVDARESDVLRPSEMNPDELADLMAAALEEDDDSAAVLAADQLAHDPQTYLLMRSQPSLEGELFVLRKLWGERYTSLVASGLTAHGATGRFLGHASTRLGEAITRGLSLPGYVLSRAIAEFREPLNDAATLFIGDVLWYLKQQGTSTAPGPIQRKLLESLTAARANQLERGDEPLVVLSHSMGGQIVYDVLTSHIPAMPEFKDVRVDFWCATASQVGLFEELKLFLASDPRYGVDEAEREVPLPASDHLGIWWNVWDHNDFISYSVDGIIGGVNDAAYDSGMSVVTAHGGYLRRPSFYRLFREELHSARKIGWRRP